MIIDEEVYLHHIADQEFADVEAFLEHFGVKGQKWGVRRDRRIALLKRASQRNGFNSGVAKVRSFAGLGPKLGPIDIIKGRGLSGGFRRKAIRMTASRKRIEAGHANTMDQLKRIGSFRLTDSIPVSKARSKKMGSVKTDVAAVALLGAGFVARRLIRQQLRKQQLG